MSITPRVTLSPNQDVAVFFTNYCNKRCKGCLGKFFNRGASRKNIRTSDLRSLRRVIGKGTEVIITGGGEPTLHPRFFESFHALCRKSGALPLPASVTIKTNGRSFSTPAATRAFLRRLKREACGVEFNVTMSIDDHHAKSETRESIVRKARNLHEIAEKEGVKHGYFAGLSPEDEGGFDSAESISDLCGLPAERRGNYLGLGQTRWKSGAEFLGKDDRRLHVAVGAAGEVYPTASAYYYGQPTGSLREKPLEEILARAHPHLLVPKNSIRNFFAGPTPHLELDLASLERATAPRRTGPSGPGIIARAKKRVARLFGK